MSIRQIISKYGLMNDRSHSRRFGQNFLIDENILNMIASCVKGSNSLTGCDFVEVGPGPCGLTIALAHMIDNKIICIEKDKSLELLHSDLLKEYQNIIFIYEDALNIDINSITNRDIVLFGNLPYNVGTKILINFISHKSKIQRIVVMLQKEVVDRICAVCGTKDYGYLSVVCQSLCNVKRLFDVDGSAFYPKPKVMSSVLELTPKFFDYKMLPKLQNITKICFEKRRKTLYNALKDKFCKKKICESIIELKLNDMSRPENLSPDLYLKLAHYFDVW